MARKAIADASEAGVTYFRISATGYAPAAHGEKGDLDLWLNAPASYWELYDQMMSDLQNRGMRIIPTFVWNVSQLPAITGETVPDLLRDPASRSYLLLVKFVTEFIERYRGHRALLFYELTNELNRGADLDLLDRCQRKKSPRLCGPTGNYTTADVINFTTRLAALIRGLDSSRPISSGFSAPRPAAQRLRTTPEWTSGKTDWRPDSREEFEKYLEETHRPVDIISVHLYDKGARRRFGPTDEVDFLNAIDQAARRIGKPLFVGEFGDPGAPDAGPGSFTERMLDRIVALKVPYSAVWIWQFYQRNPYTVYDNKHNRFSLEPGYTDPLIKKITAANKALGASVPSKADPDKVAPHVVLTWPLECTPVPDGQTLYAVASDNSGAVERVEFWLGDRKIGVDSTPPYEEKLTLGGLAGGEQEIVAKAFDPNGNSAQYKTVVIVGPPVAGGVCAGTL
jgi:hypothetical protein